MPLFISPLCLAQNYDLYDQVKTVKAPLLVYIHGGAWLGGDKEQYRPLAQAFNRDGICVAIIDYHRAPTNKHPAPIDDLQAALEAIKDKGSKSCDLKDIFLIGHQPALTRSHFGRSNTVRPSVDSSALKESTIFRPS